MSALHMTNGLYLVSRGDWWYFFFSWSPLIGSAYSTIFNISFFPKTSRFFPFKCIKILVNGQGLTVDCCTWAKLRKLWWWVVMYSKIAGSMGSSKFCCEGGMYTTRHWLQSKHRMKVPAPKNNRTQAEHLSIFYLVNRRPQDHSLWWRRRRANLEMGLVEQTKMIPWALEFKKEGLQNVCQTESPHLFLCCDLGVMELSSFQPACQKKSCLMAVQSPKLKNRTLSAVVIQQRLQLANWVMRLAFQLKGNFVNANMDLGRNLIKKPCGPPRMCNQVHNFSYVSRDFGTWNSK
jgi:hypothetical protein